MIKSPDKNAPETRAAPPADLPTPGAPPLPERASTNAIIDIDMAEEATEAAALEAAPLGDKKHVSARRAAKQDARKAQILAGPVQKGVLAIALPSVATMLLQTTNGMLDRFFVGQLGPSALAAVTVAAQIMFAVMSAGMALAVGVTALVARSIGEKNLHDARSATKQSILLALLLSVVVGVPMFLLRGAILAASGLAGDANTSASNYLSVSILGLPSLFLMLGLSGAFRGMGDTVRPFWVTLGANLTHALFNYLLIFGNFGFPKMGLPGGALALVLSQTMAMALYFLFLRRTNLRHALHSGWRLDWDWAKRILRIGVPGSVQQLLRTGSMFAFTTLLAHTGAGTDAVAALGVGLTSEQIAFMPGFGYSIAASAFVGQNLGAKQVERANKGAWAATYQAVLVMSFMGLVFYHFAEPFAHLFVHHAKGETPEQARQVEETIRLAVLYLRTAAWSEPFLAFGMVLTGALQGAGETVSPTAITAATMIAVRLPLAWLLTVYLGYDVAGAWWSMSLSTMLQGILIILLFRTGRWKTVKV